MNTPFNLQRFLDAQSTVYSQVCTELRDGYKRSHWMWFIFPQLRGLGHSYMAHKFAISSGDEARAYAEHSVLGPRLLECTELVNSIEGRSIRDIFGNPDHLKFRSSMTLFAHVTAEKVFREAIQRYFHGEWDPLTLERLES